jgi:hypothetical protein
MRMGDLAQRGDTLLKLSSAFSSMAQASCPWRPSPDLLLFGEFKTDVLLIGHGALLSGWGLIDTRSSYRVVVNSS